MSRSNGRNTNLMAIAAATRSAAPDGVQLVVTDASKRFGGVRAVEGVSLSVRRGHIASIIGPNGAGKTSLLNMISGFYTPDTGSIAVEGRDITHKRPAASAT